MDNRIFIFSTYASLVPVAIHLNIELDDILPKYDPDLPDFNPECNSLIVTPKIEDSEGIYFISEEYATCLTDLKPKLDKIDIRKDGDYILYHKNSYSGKVKEIVDLFKLNNRRNATHETSANDKENGYKTVLSIMADKDGDKLNRILTELFPPKELQQKEVSDFLHSLLIGKFPDAPASFPQDLMDEYKKLRAKEQLEETELTDFIKRVIDNFWE